MANITRRAALVGALVSSATLAVPIGRSLAAVLPRTVPDIANELRAALRAANESWEVVVTADRTLINLDGPGDTEIAMMRHMKEFIRIARLLDPTIKNAWVGCDVSPLYLKQGGHGIERVIFDRGVAA